jgi:hypothetical protein
MFGVLRLTSGEGETETYLAPIDPTKFDHVRFATSLRRASEIAESTSAELRTRSMACPDVLSVGVEADLRTKEVSSLPEPGKRRRIDLVTS